MKRLFLVFLVFCMFCYNGAALAVAAMGAELTENADGEIITDGGFEDQTQPVPSGGAYNTEKKYVHSGTSSVKTLSGVSIDIGAAESETAYMYTFYIKPEEAASGAAKIDTKIVYEAGGVMKTQQLMSSFFYPVKFDFLKTAGSFTLPAGASSPKFMISVNREAYIDDLSIKPIGKPEIVRAYPSNGETDVYIKPSIAIEFNIPMDPASFNSDTVKLNGSGDLIESALSTAYTGYESGMAICINCSELEPMREYTLSLDGVRSKDGQTMEYKEIVFKTGSMAKNLCPYGGFEDTSEAKPLGGAMYASMYSTSGFYSMQAKASAALGGMNNINLSDMEPSSTYTYSYYVKADPRNVSATEIRTFIRCFTGMEKNDYVQNELFQNEEQQRVIVNPGDDFIHVYGSFTTPANMITEKQPIFMIVARDANIIYYVDDIYISGVQKLKIEPTGDLYENALTAVNKDVLTIDFNMPVQEFEISASDIEVNGDSSFFKEARLNGDRTQLTLIPVSDLTPNRQYTVKFLNKPGGYIEGFSFKTASICEISSAAFYNGEDKIITDIQEGEVVLKVEFQNTGRTEIRPKLIMLLMKDGYMEDIVYGTTETAVESNKDGSVRAVINVTRENAEGCCIKAYLIDDFKTLQPVSTMQMIID